MDMISIWLNILEFLSKTHALNQSKSFCELFLCHIISVILDGKFPHKESYIMTWTGSALVHSDMLPEAPIDGITCHSLPSESIHGNWVLHQRYQLKTWLWLTHWGWDKMDPISQTTLSSTFSWMKMQEFRLKFHWSLFLRDQLIIFLHWFR